MTFVYLICFLLAVAGIVIVLGLTPEKITNDLMRVVSPKETFREKMLIAKGKKKSRKLTVVSKANNIILYKVQTL